MDTMPSTILSVGSRRAISGAPATTSSAVATTSAVASAVESACASEPMPAAMARATAAVFPQ